MSNTLEVTLQKDNVTKAFYIVNSSLSVDDASKVLVDASCPNKTVNGAETEAEVVENFLNRTGTILSLDTPQSSNIDSVTFNALTKEIGFVFDNGSQSLYSCTFKEFLDNLRAPSFGKLQWTYRRASGQTSPKIGDRVRVISTPVGARGAIGHLGTVTSDPSRNGLDGGLRVRLDGTSYPAGVWSLGEGAVVKVLE